MAARGYVPSAYEGRSIQASGIMRHGPYPGLSPAVHHPLEPLPPPKLLEDKIVAQGAEMERLARENHRLAATHSTLRQDLIATQQEMQRMQMHAGSVKTESDVQIRGLLDKITKFESDIRAGELLRKELQQVHMEAQKLVATRQELASQVQRATEEFQKANADLKRLPEMHSELERLRQEHQKLRAAFEYEKGSNMEQVEQMQLMEKNLIDMARQMEKLRADVLSAGRRAHAPSPYGSQYRNHPHSVQHPPSGQATAFMSHGYRHAAIYTDANYSRAHADGHSSSYSDSSFAQGGGSNYTDGYGRPLVPKTTESYGRPLAQTALDGYGRPLVQMAPGPAAVGAAVGEEMNLYTGAATIAAYDAARGTPTSVRR